MNPIASALATGGIEAGRIDGDRVPAYSALADPRGAEPLGTALSAAIAANGRVQRDGVSRIVVWDTGDLVLAHVVARELGVPIAQGIDAQGVVELIGEVAPGDRVAVVASAIRNAHHLLAMQAVVRNAQAQVIVVGTLVDSPALRASAGEADVIALTGGSQ